MAISTVLVFIGIAFLLAFFVETMIEYILGTPIDNIKQLQFLREYKWVLRYVAAGVGVYFAFYWKIDLVSITASVISDLVDADILWEVSNAGIVVSGLAIGRGSNYLHEFLSKHLKKPDVLG